MSTLQTQEATSCNKQKIFVTILAKFPVLLSKSQLPEVKVKKAQACEKFLEEYLHETGIQLTKEQLFKKINNMKTAIKTKADVKHQTGTKPIILSDWEEEFLNVLHIERNPAFGQMSGTYWTLLSAQLMLSRELSIIRYFVIVVRRV